MACSAQLPGGVAWPDGDKWQRAAGRVPGAQTVPRDGTAEILPQGVLLSISKPGSGQGKQMFVPWSNVKFIMFVKEE